MPPIITTKKNGHFAQIDHGLLRDFGRDKRQAIADAIRLTHRQFTLEAYIIITEAWVAADKPGEPGSLSAADRPDRTEAVICVAGDPHRTVFRVYDLLRGPDGLVCGLGPPKTIGNELTQNRFSGLLMPEPTRH